MVSYPGLSERGAFMGLIPYLFVLLIAVSYSWPNVYSRWMSSEMDVLAIKNLMPGTYSRSWLRNLSVFDLILTSALFIHQFSRPYQFFFTVIVLVICCVTDCLKTVTDCLKTVAAKNKCYFLIISKGQESRNGSAG